MTAFTRPFKALRTGLGRFWYLLTFDLRVTAAYTLMLGFIIGTSVGVAMILPAAGLITFGVTCGVVGYILGAE